MAIARSRARRPQSLQERWGFEWGIDWIDTHVKERTLFQTLDGDRLRDTHRGRLVLSVARRF